jgi:hypothetical protein
MYVIDVIMNSHYQLYFLFLLLLILGYTLFRPYHSRSLEHFQLGVNSISQQWCNSSGTCFQEGDNRREMAQELLRVGDTYIDTKQECSNRMVQLTDRMQQIQSTLKTEPDVQDGPCVDPETGQWGVRVQRLGKACVPSKDASSLVAKKDVYKVANDASLFSSNETPCYEKSVATVSYLDKMCKNQFSNTWGLKEIVDCLNEPNKVRGQCAEGYDMGADISQWNDTTLACRRKEDLLNPDIICAVEYPNVVPIGQKRIYYGKQGGCINEKGQYDSQMGRLVCSPVYRNGYIRYTDADGMPIYATESCFSSNQEKDMDNECKRLYTGSSGYQSSSTQLNCPVNMVRGICKPVL